MLVDVETFLLYSLVNTYTYRLINHLELTAAVHLACLLVVRHKMRQRGQTLQAA